MMAGDGLIRVARSVLHEDTFELMVAPAIADLQIDATPAAYAAAWSSLAGACAEDFWLDVRAVAEDAAMLGVLMGIQASYYACMLMLLAAHISVTDAVGMLLSGPGQPFLLAVSLLVTVSAVPTLVCFWPPRRVRESDP